MERIRIGRRAARAVIVLVGLATLLGATSVAPRVTIAATTVSWSAFYAHELSAAAREDVYRDDLWAAVDAQDLGAFATAGRNLYRLAKKEAAWLTSHRPQTCYRDWWAIARNYWTQVRQGSADIVRATQTLDPDLIDAAEVHFDRADIYLDRLELHLPTC